MILNALDHRGFSLIELLLSVALIGTIVGMSVPVMIDVTAAMKLNSAARLIERELQGARLKSVSVNRSLRVRLNCPGAGYIRRIEVIGTPAIDDVTNRCLTSAYPFPAPDNDLTSRPNYDGPVLILPIGATVTGVDLQFNPDGTTSKVVNNAVQPLDTTTLTITRLGKSRTVTVNGAGKIQLQP
jgi:prepilin-type N-terminal cleavage/methylation domain-containing protein